MQCPACQHETKEKTAGDVTVDVCAGCGGMWFGPFELPKLEYTERSAGEALIDMPRDPSVHVDLTPKRSCPVCHVPMFRHFESVQRRVTVDECPQCGGEWLDAGELATIRSEYTSEDERDHATTAYFDDLFKVQIDAQRADDKEQADRIERFRHKVRFILPSYYFQGKHRW